jgi:surface carbohydrate biosynthesis protein
MFNIVYIPIEKKIRELRPRLLVAGELVERGTTVVIGLSRGVFSNAPNFPTGVVLYKGLNKVQSIYMKTLKELNYKQVATDEEALGSCDGVFMMQDCWPETKNYIDKVFCQGLVHSNALRETREFSENQLAITGNPRIDLLRAPFTDAALVEARRIREKMGPFILINTDLGAVNSPNPDLELYRRTLIQIGWIRPDVAADNSLFEDHIQHDTNNLRAIEQFILEMHSKLPKRLLILRPHPSEDARFWQSLADRVSNLRIVTDTEAIPWTLASDCLVQTGCTTGVEAAILGVPSIGLVCQPERIMHPQVRLAHKLNVVYRSVSDAIEAIRWMPSNDAVHQPRLNTDLLRRVAPYLDIEKDRYSFQKIADEIIKLLADAKQHESEHLQPIKGIVDASLRKSVGRSVFDDGYFDRDDLDKMIDGRFRDIKGLRRAKIIDLNWGVYALVPHSHD